VPSELLSLFESFLAAMADPDAGADLYRLHTPDAIVPCTGGVKPAREIDCDTFAALHSEIAAQGASSLPYFAKPVCLHVSDDDAHSGQTVSWFEVTETRTQRKVTAALGSRVVDGTPLIGWATLNEGVRNWSYADGYLHSIADYPWMRLSEPAHARALIDASYFRLYWRSSVKLTSLPNARFSCQMSTVCCKHDFEITLPAEAQLVIDAIPWERVKPELQGTRLTSRPDGKLQLKTLNEVCRFLGPQRQCLIHQTLGRQPFGPCCIFPVAFAETPDGVTAALSPICDATRHGVGPTLADREDDLRERLIHAKPRQPNGFRLLPSVEVPWDTFRNVEKALCDILAADDSPMRRRLYVGSRVLGALRDQEPLQIDSWIREPMVPITPELRKAIHDMLTKVLAWDRATLRKLPTTIPPELSQREVNEPEVVARILENTLFSKVYSYPFDLTTAYNFLIVLYLLTLLMQEAAGGRLDEPMWRELGSVGVHGLLKSMIHDGVPEGFRQLFGTAEFGMWMLSA
jgi:hypothetical protein